MGRHITPSANPPYLQGRLPPSKRGTIVKDKLSILLTVILIAYMCGAAVADQQCISLPCGPVGCFRNNETPCRCPAGTVKKPIGRGPHEPNASDPWCESSVAGCFLCVAETSEPNPPLSRCTPPPAVTNHRVDGSMCLTFTNPCPTAIHFYYSSSIVGSSGGPVVCPGQSDRSTCGRPGETLRGTTWNPDRSASCK